MASVFLSSSGGGLNLPKAVKALRLVRHGCANRPFYHVVVMMRSRNQHDHPIEQVGSFDPMPNSNNEKLVAFNFERIQYWMGKGVVISEPVAELLGLCGFLPVHPVTYMTAWRNRKKPTENADKQTESANSGENESK